MTKEQKAGERAKARSTRRRKVVSTARKTRGCPSGCILGQGFQRPLLPLHIFLLLDTFVLCPPPPPSSCGGVITGVRPSMHPERKYVKSRQIKPNERNRRRHQMKIYGEREATRLPIFPPSSSSSKAELKPQTSYFILLLLLSTPLYIAVARTWRSPGSSASFIFMLLLSWRRRRGK